MKKIILIALLCFSWDAAAQTGPEIAEAAKKQVGITKYYDPNYRKIGYPGGDVAIETGVCADVIIRAYRMNGIDLQKEIHEDMKENFDKYPKTWGLKRPDTNIDHRRVPNIGTFLKRHGAVLPKDQDFKPGDIVTWNLNPKGSLPHIGIVSKRTSLTGTPLIIHNIGMGTKEENILFDYPVTGHYRYP